MLAASITRLQPAPTLAASTHGCSQHPHLQPALTLGSSTHACSQHDTHPSLVHSRVFSNECNSNNFSRIQHNVVAARTHACSQHPRLHQHPHLQPAPTLAASTHACSQHLRLQPAPTRAARTHACSQHPRLQAAPTLVATMHACSQHPTRAAAISPANAHPYHRDALHFFSPLTLCPYSQLNVLKVLHLLPTHCFLTLSEFSVFSRSKLSFSALLISFFFGFRALGVLPPTSCNRVFLSL